MNKEKKRQIILLSVAIFLMMYFLYDRNILSPKDIVEQVGKLTNLTSSVQEMKIDDLRNYTQTKTLTKLDWTGSWNSDPFYYVSENSLSVSPESGIMDKLFGKSNSSFRSRLELTGISWQGNSGFAIVSNSVVKEGDLVGGYLVEKIAFNHVVMVKGSQSMRLSLNE